MSLISGANFVAPLRSKVQIVGIFALAALVAVVRLTGVGSGGDSEVGSVAVERANPRDEEAETLAEYRRRVRSREGAGSAGDAQVEKLFNGESSSTESRRPTAKGADTNAGEPMKLNEIARSVGIE